MTRILNPKALSRADIDHVNRYFLVSTIHVPCDMAFLLGVQSPNIHRPMVAAAAQKYHAGYFNTIAVSGAPLVDGSHLSEAEEMVDTLRKDGVSNKHIIVENHATNTQENVEFVRDIMTKQRQHRRHRQTPLNTVFCFGNAYGGRRILMTMARRWPHVTPAMQLVGPRPDFKDTWQDHDYDRQRICWEFNKLVPYTQKDFLREVNIRHINARLRKFQNAAHVKHRPAPHRP